MPGFYQIRKGNFWIARIEDRVVGTIALLDIGNDMVALRKMFVDKEYRGAKVGVAYRLLKHALAWAKEKAIHQLFLGTTTQFLAAHKFYEKNGFTKLEKEELPSTFPLVKVDKIFYKLYIR
nr:GNAT family N-acetyltransferase [Bacillus coahuilensis]